MRRAVLDTSGRVSAAVWVRRCGTHGDNRELRVGDLLLKLGARVGAGDGRLKAQRGDEGHVQRGKVVNGSGCEKGGGERGGEGLERPGDRSPSARSSAWRRRACRRAARGTRRRRA
eukprot:2219773-Prymnesium_polylepis.1